MFCASIFLMLNVKVGLDQELAMPQVSKSSFIHGIFFFFLISDRFVRSLTKIVLLCLQGSYMLDYFKYLYKYFEVGVPVYFVTKRGFNFTAGEGMNAVCSSVGCDQFSMTQKIRYATDHPDR